MIEVTSIVVRSYDLDYLDVFWTLNEQSEERVEEYDFYILRSIDGPAGPFQTIAGPFYNTFQFRDGDVHRLHKWRQYYYKIKLTHRATNQSREFGPQYLSAPPDRIALEIQRREKLLWREFAGREVFLFPRLTFGQRCKHCWDIGPRGNTIGRSVQQNCASCFDTTYVGGYASPIALHMQIDPTPIAVEKTDLKEHQFIQSTARTVSFPPIKPKDMIVEAENKRWNVERVTYTEKGRAVLRQELIISQFPPDDIKYVVPVNADLLREHRPERAFTRPMDIQSREEHAVLDTWGIEP